MVKFPTILLLFIISGSIGCGVKGPPLPPIKRAPEISSEKMQPPPEEREAAKEDEEKKKEQN